MSRAYDVVIAGAGPAGAQCARDLAARDYDVLLLETEPETDFPRQSNKSTGGTFPWTMSSFGVPDDVVMQFTDKVVLESPNDHFIKRQAGVVLDFAAFKRFLVEDGRDQGVELRFDARVTGPLLDDGEIVGVEYNGSETARGRLIIDATGPSASLARALDVVELKREKQAIGIEYELERVELNHSAHADLTNAMMLRLDHEVAPGGYAWIFHTGDDTAKVGICYIQNQSHQVHARDGFSIDDYLQQWIDTDPRFNSAQRIDQRQHRGSAHMQLPTQMSTDNFMAIGDTVPSVDPLWGEGIDNCMRSGREAAIVADSCLSPGRQDTSAERMSEYDRRWHSEVAPNARSRLLMTELLYRASNERYDELLADLNRLDGDVLARANDGDVRALLRILKPTDVRTISQVVLDRISIGA